MELLAAAGARYELAEARRFRQSREGPASLRLRAGEQEVPREYHRQGRLRDAGTREQAEAAASRAWLADTVAGRRSLLVVDTNEQGPVSTPPTTISSCWVSPVGGLRGCDG
jgi:hypothetical protein